MQGIEPCGHIVVCSNCASSITRCPVPTCRRLSTGSFEPGKRHDQLLTPREDDDFVTANVEMHATDPNSGCVDTFEKVSPIKESMSTSRMLENKMFGMSGKHLTGFDRAKEAHQAVTSDSPVKTRFSARITDPKPRSITSMVV